VAVPVALTFWKGSFCQHFERERSTYGGSRQLPLYIIENLSLKDQPEMVAYYAMSTNCVAENRKIETNNLYNSCNQHQVAVTVAASSMVTWHSGKQFNDSSNSHGNATHSTSY